MQDVPPIALNFTDPMSSKITVSSLALFTKVNKARYNFTKFAIVAADETTRANAVAFF